MNKPFNLLSAADKRKYGKRFTNWVGCVFSDQNSSPSSPLSKPKAKPKRGQPRRVVRFKGSLTPSTSADKDA